MKRRTALLLACAMACTMITGCGKKEEAPQQATEQTAAEAADTDADVVADRTRNLLTGLPATEEEASKRPVGIMIENTQSAMPSYGITRADVIYEFPVEGGITRFLALYSDYSGMDRIGSIRSSREYFAYTAIAYDAIYVHCGGSIETYNNILDLGLVDNCDARLKSGFTYRSSDRKSPHNLSTSSEDIDSIIEKLGYATEHDASYAGALNFNKDNDNEVTLDDGEDAAVVVAYQAHPKPWFVYNEEDGLYYRYQFGEPQVDGIDGSQVAVKNIIIQECTVDAYFDEQNHDRVDIGTLTGGKGKYITNGKAVDITWTCDGNGEPTHYYYEDGTEVELNQGKTFFEVTDLDYSDRNVIYATEDDYNASK